MRSVTVVMRHPDGFHPAARELAAEAGIRRETLFQLNVLDDGTAVVLCRIRGDLDRARELIGERPDVLGYSVSGGRTGEGVAYVHTRPPAVVEAFVRIPREHEVVFDFPLEGVDETGVRVTMIGETNEVLERALAAVPEEVEATVERIGSYPPATRDLSALLTERQREILDVAIDSGYYEVPRRTSHRGIAAETGVSVATVGEHIQEIEARVFEALASNSSAR